MALWCIFDVMCLTAGSRTHKPRKFICYLSSGVLLHPPRTSPYYDLASYGYAMSAQVRFFRDFRIQNPSVLKTCKGRLLLLQVVVGPRAVFIKRVVCAMTQVHGARALRRHCTLFTPLIACTRDFASVSFLTSPKLT